MARITTFTNENRADQVVHDYRHRGVVIPGGGGTRTLILADAAAEFFKRRTGALKVEVGASVDDEKLAEDRNYEKTVMIQNRDKQAEGGDRERETARAAGTRAGGKPAGKSYLQEGESQLSAKDLLEYEKDKENFDFNFYVRQARGVVGDDLDARPSKKEVTDALRKKA
jgi:hypothetical protein